MNRENEIVEIRVDEIIPNRFQPRLAFNQTELKELSDSIKVHGIIQPLVLRRIGDKYEIIAGERRHKAAMMAGLRTVPAIIMNINDKQSAEVAVVENLQRKDLSAMEEAQSYKKLTDMGITQEELAKRMGVAQSTIANKLRLLGLTKEVQDSLLKNQISERHARSLLQIPDQSLQVIMLNRIITERLTVRQTDEEISKIIGRPITSQQTISTPEPSPMTNTADNLSNMFNQQMQRPMEYGPDNLKAQENKVNPIDMLLRKEPAVEEKAFAAVTPAPTETINQNVDELIKPGMAINPFQEVAAEVINFDIPTPQLEKPTMPIQEQNTNSLIEEFKEQNPDSYQTPPITKPVEQVNKNISKAINAARSEVKKIEELGFEVDTEEFDFEDMYQIIIKIKKD